MVADEDERRRERDLPDEGESVTPRGIGEQQPPRGSLTVIHRRPLQLGEFLSIFIIMKTFHLIFIKQRKYIFQNNF